MAELVGGAIGGAVVGAALTVVVDLSKKAWRCSDDCEKLARSVDSARPHVEALKDLESKSCQDWLQELKDLLDEAKDIMEKYCVRNSKRWIVSPVFRVFYVKKSKLSLNILDINERIQSKVGDANLLNQIYGATSEIYDQTTMILHEKDKTKTDKIDVIGSSNCYVPRVLPSKIVSFENKPFRKLKSLIISKCDIEHPPITLGLIGCGGAGKTLVAQMLHNDGDVKVKYGKEAILWVTVGRDGNLSQVYKKMGKFLSISVVDKDVGEQFTSLMDGFQKTKVLLILDDVWDQDIGAKSLMEWLSVAKGKGSITLVTTRSNDVLRSARVEQSISIPLLSLEKSWELFCSHAFRIGVLVPREIEEIANQVCKTCGGLPLALEVIGASMYDKVDVWRWEYAKGKLINLQGKDKVLETLKYSYEEVKEEEQKLFLYFAAFPEDYEIPTEILCSIWHVEHSNMIHGGLETVYTEGMEKLFTLADRSLIKLSEDAKMATIHDILRELAMDIIEKTSIGENYFHVGKNLKGLPTPIPKNMKRMSLMGGSVGDSLNEMNQGDLEVLMLSNLHGRSGMETILRSFPKSTKLLYVNLSNLGFEYFPEGIGKLRALMYLNISWCWELKNLPKDIVELEALISLNLSGCVALEKLPEGMGKMTALTSLNISSCRCLRTLPTDIVELDPLTFLNLSWCVALEKLPEGMGKMKALTSLDLSWCQCLLTLPKDIVELEALISLNLSHCKALEKLPEGMGKMKALISLDLSSCGRLQTLPKDIRELESLLSLNLSGCEALKKLPIGMGKMKALPSLDLSNCLSLQTLPKDIVELDPLTSLNLSWCVALRKLPEGMGKMKALTSLDLSNCHCLQILPKDIGKLRALMYLNISWCCELKNLPKDIVELEALISLNLSHCKALKKLPEGMGKMKALTSVDLSSCGCLQTLPKDIGELESLLSLNLSGCEALVELPEGMGKMKAHTSLYISCPRLRTLPKDIGELEALISLNLSWCLALEQLPEGMGKMKALASLDLSMCRCMQTLPKDIGELEALISLNLSGCVALKELPEGMGKMKALTFLDLSWCTSLMELPEGVKELKALTSLDVSGCTFLGDFLESIKDLTALTSLDHSSCELLEELNQEGIKKLQVDSLTCGQCSSSGMMELKEKSSESFETGKREALSLFEFDEPIDVDPSRLHLVAPSTKNGKDIEALPSVTSSHEILDDHGKGNKPEAELIKVQAIDIVYVDIEKLEALQSVKSLHKNEDVHDKGVKLEAELIKVHAIDMDYAEDFKKMTFEEILENLIAWVQGVEAQVAKFLQLGSSKDIQVFKGIHVFNQECGFLIDTLSHTVHDRLRYYNDMLRIVQETGVNNQCRIMIYMIFCIVALSELERMFHPVVDLLSMCSDEKWWNTALELSNVLSSSSIPRWSRFSLAIRSCEWSMDIVDLAFHALQQFLAGASILPGVVFKWSDKQLRMVLHIDGKPLYRKEGDRSLLDVTRELEGKDVTALIDKLEALKILKKNHSNESSNNIFGWKLSSKVDTNLLSIADFLRKKLRGPTPEPSSLPDTFELDPSTLTLKRFIESGGHGTVGKYEWLGQSVGVKTISEVSRKELKAEAAILASVQHPNVVRMIGCGFEEKDEAKNEDEEENEDDSAKSEDIAKTGYLVMELMQDDLRKVINKRCRKPASGKSPFSLTVAIDIMLQIGEGMRYLREHKILHRDLKAKNVLVNRCSTNECSVYKKFPNRAALFRPKKYQSSCYYVAKLADFGIAKARRNETSFKTPKLGTGVWRAPEVLNVTEDKYEWPADVYSFAMTCYEILTGRVPFDEVPPTKLHQHIEAGGRPPLDDVLVPRHLRDLVERCWETDPNKRPSFDEICKTLWQCKVEIILPGFILQIGP